MVGNADRRYAIKELIKEKVIEIQTGPFGSQLHSEDYCLDGIPVVPTEAIGRGKLKDIEYPKISLSKSEELRRHRLAAGDILFARRGAQAAGLSALIEQHHANWICGTGAILLRIKKCNIIDPKFLSLQLSSDLSIGWLKQHAVGAVMPNLNSEIIGNLPIWLPRLPIQRQIASILSTFDDKIELNRRMNRTLEQMARALFRSWFVDFDPVRAKMCGEQPAGMDAETAALFPDRLVEIDGREIPKAWEVKQFKDVIDLYYGKTLKAEQRMGGFIPVYGSNGIIGYHNTSLVRGPGIIVGRKGSAGTVIWSDGDFFPIDTTFYVGMKHFDVSLSHIYFTLLELNLPSISADSAVPGLNRDAALLQTYVKPPEQLTVAADVFLSQYQLKIAANLRESAHLAQLRDALLPRLLSGEVDVSTWDSPVEALGTAPA